jgi:prevent-host-death family protein
MRAMTIKDAKARLNELVDAAVSGEQVVLMRGSKHVAAIVPLTVEDLEIAPRLTDDQAERFWRLLAEQERTAGTRAFSTAPAAVAHLARKVRSRKRKRG